MGWFSKKEAPPKIARDLVAAYQATFSADKFHSLFQAGTFSSEQSMDIALAEWHAFGAFVFTRSLWVVYQRAEQVSPILDCFRPSMLNALSLNEATLEHFLKVASERERDYMARFPKSNDGTEISVFFGYAAARITGHFSEANDFLEMPQDSDPIVTLALSQHAAAVMVATIKMLKNG